MKLFLGFLIIYFFGALPQPDSRIRRIKLKEYPGGTILPTKIKNEVLTTVLFDGRYIKAMMYDYRGKMFLQCYSSDSVLLESGNYVNSLSLLKEQVVSLGPTGNQNRIIVVEYYQPLRHGKWLFYDSSTGKPKDSCFYLKGVKKMTFPVPE